MVLVFNKTIIQVMDSYEQKENGKLINGCIYPMGEVVNISVPEYVEPQKYCYDVSNGFYINPDYKEYKSQEQINEEIQSNQAQIIMALVAGGLM